MPKNRFNLVILGRPYTKKNSGVFAGAGRFLPSKQYREFEKSAIPQLHKQFHNEPIDFPVSVRVHYFMRDRKGWPDLVGLMQATADILEKAGVVKNDRLITSWSGTEISGIDKENPRSEINILRVWWPPDTQEMRREDNPYNLDPYLVKKVANERHKQNR